MLQPYFRCGLRRRVSSIAGRPIREGVLVLNSMKAENGEVKNVFVVD